MKITTELMYLGYESKISQKTGNSYLMVKFVERDSKAVFEFYVKAEQLDLITSLGKCQEFTDVKCKLNIVSNQGKADVRLEGVQG